MKDLLAIWAVILVFTSCMNLVSNDIEEKNNIKDEDKMVCTEQYDPVCAKVKVQCIQAPCDPVKETFSNECFAKAGWGFEIVKGECELL